MLKSIVLFSLLCGFTLSAEQTLKRPNISVLRLLHSRNLFTVKLDGLLYSLIWKNITHVEAYMTNRTIASTEQCTFDTREPPFNAIDPFKILNTAVLSDDQTIAALGFRNHSSDGNDYYDLFLFDLINCDHKMIKTELLNKVPFAYEYRPQLVANNESFDVFIAGEEQCSPCRYSNEGEPIELEHNLEMDVDEQFLSFHVRLLDPIDTERNYLYIQNFRNDTAVIKLLNEDFEVVKERRVNYEIPFVSVNKDVGAPIGICYFPNQNRNQLSCERLDFYLHPVLRPFAVTAPLDSLIGNATVTLDDLGNTFVAVVHAPLHTTKKQIAVFRYDKYGQLAEAFDLGSVDNGVTEHVVELESYIAEGMENQYCVVAYQIMDVDKHNTHIKCFPAPKDDLILQ